jgi:hypothetical protein
MLASTREVLLQSQLEAWKEKLCATQAQKCADEETYTQAIEAHARRSCTSLCQVMYARLPPELREEVYSHLIGPPDTESVNGPEPRGRVSHSRCVVERQSFLDLPLQELRFGAAEYEHWLYDAHTGERVGREIVAHWYHTRVFCFKGPAERKWIRKFLRNDVFGKGLVPGDLVRHVEVVIWYSDMANPQTIKALQLDLDALECFGNKQVLLKLRIPGDDPIFNDLVIDRVGFLKPTICRLREKGLERVQVWQRGTKESGWVERECTAMFD